ncbi:MAG: exopolysaccharide biosynthesis polyprenyl glycosylphosphotransferase [Reyranellaceae bacterium]
MSIATDIGDALAGYVRPRARNRKSAAVLPRDDRRGRLATRRTSVAIVGVGPLSRQVVWRCLQQSSRGLEILGLFADGEETQAPGYCLGCPAGGSLDNLLALAQTREIDAIVLAIPATARRRIENVVAQLRRIAVDVYLYSDDADETPPADTALARLPVRLLERRPLGRREVLLKAVEDRVLAAGILLAISPLLLAIALLIRLDSPGPVIFRQKRYGLNNRLIEIWKFRTLHVCQSDTNAEQLVTRNDSRVTRVGAFLRRTSLDELPQFFNVLRGEMSVVGPRPHALAAKAGVLQYDEIVRDYATRHRVKPGITGWAQINGWRGETSTPEQIEQRVAHDFHYIDNWSLLLDLKIVLRTITGGFGGRQAY